MLSTKMYSTILYSNNSLRKPTTAHDNLADAQGPGVKTAETGVEFTTLEQFHSFVIMRCANILYPCSSLNPYKSICKTKSRNR